ncbi:MAG: hypothetical protein ACT4PM_10040 [Gemmatimonadales bacterium]
MSVARLLAVLTRSRRRVAEPPSHPAVQRSGHRAVLPFRLAAILLCGLPLAAACGNGGEPSNAGDLLVTYHAGSSDAGAMMLTISGGMVENVTAVGSQAVSFSKPFPTTTRVVVIGTFTTGDLLRIRVPDVSLATSYVVRADQVAHTETFALIDPSQHTFTVHR